jgi:glycosyltransferase involved in cell wall biosynthesis
VRIAALVYLAPRKLGSLEQWVMEFLAECSRRGHQVHLFCDIPIHPAVERRLVELGVKWTRFQQLERNPRRWGRVLSRSFDIIYMNLVVPRSRGAYAAYLAWPRPVLLFDGISGPMPGQGLRSWIGRILDPLILTRITALAGCSEYVRKRDRRRFHLSADQCTVIYNGIDTNRFLPPSWPYSDVPVIATVARLIPEKGVDLLIEACLQLQHLPWMLKIVGDGVEEARLKALVKEVGLEHRTEFLGLRHDVEAVLGSTEIYVHPCLWEEAFGLTIAEAMACGCATIASRVGGIPEIIEDGKSGILVERGDLPALTRALRDLLRDPSRRRRLGQEARKRAVERFGLTDAVNLQVDWIEHWGARRKGEPRAG